MNKRVLITAGPTHEKIDPVRFIGNHSSGRMGYAIAEVFAEAGAEVLLVSGPVELKPVHPGIRLINVTTADEMYRACSGVVNEMDIAIFNAAVADFTPVRTENRKIKSGPEGLNIALKPTINIAEELGKHKRPGQIFVGFALETDNEAEHALEKLRRKNLDLIILNSLQDEGAGFRVDTNRVTFMERGGNVEQYGLKPKKEVARDIFLWIEKRIKDA